MSFVEDALLKSSANTQTRDNQGILDDLWRIRGMIFPIVCHNFRIDVHGQPSTGRESGHKKRS